MLSFFFFNWLTANNLSLNVKKSHFVIFHPYQRKLNYLLVDLKMFDNDSKTFISLEHKNYVKYLGILIDSNLVWKNHINRIASKISKTIGTISKSKDIHNYDTRSSSNVNFYVKHSRLNILDNSFSRTGARIWNSIPGDLCNLAKNKFKERVQQIVLQILSEEDDYVDLRTLIKQVKTFNYAK